MSYFYHESWNLHIKLCINIFLFICNFFFIWWIKRYFCYLLWKEACFVYIRHVIDKIMTSRRSMHVYLNVTFLLHFQKWKTVIFPWKMWYSLTPWKFMKVVFCHSKRECQNNSTAQTIALYPKFQTNLTSRQWRRKNIS